MSRTAGWQVRATCETVSGVKPGDAIGAYRLESPVGRSQIGESWRAVHTQLERRVRLLVVQLPEQLKAEIQDTFARRVLPLSHFQATQLDRLVDSGLTADGSPYFVTELLIGEPLDEHLNREGALTLEQAVEYGAEAFEGLAVMHEAGLAHGRVAPGRAFLVRTKSIDGPVSWLRLLDVGFAYVLNLPAQVEADARCLAPELANGEAPTNAGDVYAAGRLVEIMLGGNDPQAELATLLRTCTDPDPTKRPSAADARSGLARIRDANKAPAQPMAQLVVEATPASGAEGGLLGGWDAPAPADQQAAAASAGATPTPARKAPAAVTAPQSSGSTLGGWGAQKKDAAPGRAKSPSLLYGLAALSALAIVAFIIRAVMIAPGNNVIPDFGAVAAAPAVDAVLVDAAIDAGGLADGAIDPKNAVRVIVSPAGATFTQIESQRVLCEAAGYCLVPVDEDTTIELEGHEPKTLKGDDLYDRRGGKWIIRMYPKMPKEEEPKRRKRRKRR